MKILLRRSRLAEEPTPVDDITNKNHPRSERQVHRRIEITTKREILSILVRRPAQDKAGDQKPE